MIIDGHQDDQYTLRDFVTKLINREELDYYYSKPTLAKMALEAIDILGCWECFSCGVDTFALGEDFYVQDELWRTYGVEGMLCILCFEKRLGRPLVPDDFQGDGGGPRDDDPIFPNYRRSDRFKDRAGPQLEVMV